MWWKDSADTDVLALPLKCWPRHLLAELRTLAAPCTQTETVTRKYTTCLWREQTLWQTCASLTKWNTAGQSWALCLSSGGTVALHHTVVQQMARTGIGERSTFKLHGIHLMDKTTWTQITERRKKERLWMTKQVYKYIKVHRFHHQWAEKLTCNPGCGTSCVRMAAGSWAMAVWPGLCFLQPLSYIYVHREEMLTLPGLWIKKGKRSDL